MITKRNVIHLVILVLLALNLAFIFIQSALPPEKSAETSDKVGDIVEEVIPPETKPGSFIQKHLRKIAHFIEFAALGLLSSVYVIFLGESIKRVALSIVLAPSVALIDETVQLFSDRGASVKDVWIDSFGFFTAALIFYTVYHLVKIIVKKVNNCRQNTTE